MIKSKLIELSNLKVLLRRSRLNKNLRLVIKADGQVMVSSPSWVPLGTIKNFVSSRSEWIAGKLQQRQRSGSLFAIVFSALEIKKLKKSTAQLVASRLNFFNQHYGFHWRRIAIRNQSTRWGSCSKAGNLNFNCRLSLLSPELADYIIVHELCHLAEMNHSVSFWELVSQTIPNHRNLRLKLRKF